MKKEEKLDACKEQFLYPQFLEEYYVPLIKLHNNKSFMSNIRDISEHVADSLLYGAGIYEDATRASRFQDFKSSFCDIFFNSLKFSDYPEYKEIYYSIKRNGYSGKSATISVFYAMVYLDVLNEVEEKQETSRNGLWRKLFQSKEAVCKTNAILPTENATPSKVAYSDSFLRKEFKSYLIRQGYRQYTESGHPSTVYSYLKGIDRVCAAENLSWTELAENIVYIVLQYDSGGTKEVHGSQSHRTVINALSRYSEFCARIK